MAEVVNGIEWVVRDDEIIVILGERAPTFRQFLRLATSMLDVVGQENHELLGVYRNGGRFGTVNPSGAVAFRAEMRQGLHEIGSIQAQAWEVGGTEDVQRTLVLYGESRLWSRSSASIRGSINSVRYLLHGREVPVAEFERRVGSVPVARCEPREVFQPVVEAVDVAVGEATTQGSSVRFRVRTPH